MSQSIDKEKNSRKNFSALDKIKKSKKNNVVEQEIEKKEEQFNIDSVLKNNVDDKYISTATILNTPNSIEEESVVLVEKDVVEIAVDKRNENEEQTFDIASKLKQNPIQELENIQPSNTFLAKEPELEVKIETRTSAAIAKDRLREDVLGLRETVKTSPVNLGYKRTITANDNLNQILGSSQIQQVEIYSDEESSLEKNDVVITNNSIFIPWEKAPDEDKRKARKIVKAGVASTLLALTYFTFH